jgi:hypothetical protein
MLLARQRKNGREVFIEQNEQQIGSIALFFGVRLAQPLCEEILRTIVLEALAWSPIEGTWLPSRGTV